MVLDSIAGTRAQTGRTFLKVLCSLIGIWVFSILAGCTTTKVLQRLTSHDPLPPGTEIQVIDLPDARLLEPPASMADSALSVVDDPSSKVNPMSLGKEEYLTEWKRKMDERYSLDRESADSTENLKYEIIAELSCTSYSGYEECIDSLKDQARDLGANAIIIKYSDFELQGGGANYSMVNGQLYNNPSIPLSKTTISASAVIVE